MALNGDERQARLRAQHAAKLEALRKKHKQALYETRRETAKLRELVGAILRISATAFPRMTGPVKLSGTLKRGDYNRFALQPDTYQNLSDAERNEAFRLWEELKPIVLYDPEDALERFMRHLRPRALPDRHAGDVGFASQQGKPWSDDVKPPALVVENGVTLHFENGQRRIVVAGA